jgi:hypothetical protein
MKTRSQRGLRPWSAKRGKRPPWVYRAELLKRIEAKLVEAIAKAPYNSNAYEVPAVKRLMKARDKILAMNGRGKTVRRIIKKWR